MRFRYHNNVCYHFSAGGREGGRKTSSRLSKPPRLMALFLLKAQHVFLILTLKTWKQFSNFRTGSRPLSGHSSQGKLKHRVVTINWLSWLHLQLWHWGIPPAQSAQHWLSCGPLVTHHQRGCMRLKCAKGRRNCSCHRWRAVTQPEGLTGKSSCTQNTTRYLRTTLALNNPSLWVKGRLHLLVIASHVNSSWLTECLGQWLKSTLE